MEKESINTNYCNIIIFYLVVIYFYNIRKSLSKKKIAETNKQEAIYLIPCRKLTHDYYIRIIC